MPLFGRLETCQTAARPPVVALARCIRMSSQSISRTLVNPRPEALRLVLSDGSERVVPPWGIAVLPRSSAHGQPVDILQALVLERRVIPGRIESPPT